MSSTLTLSVSHTDAEGRFHRVNVKAGLSSSMRQVIQQACMALKLVPSPESSECYAYGLKHGRMQLDKATLVRLSGLTQGAKLELIKTTNLSAGGSVTVAVQSEAGRATTQVSSSSTFLSILQIVANSVDAPRNYSIVKLQNGVVMEPVLLVMGQEYAGLAQIAQTSLVGIGIDSGTCLVRLSHRPSAFGSLEEATEYIEKETSIPLTIATLPQDANVPAVNADRSVESEAPEATRTMQKTMEPPVARRAVLIAPPRANTAPTPDLPDSAYKVDVGDFQRYYAAAQARTRSLLDAPLVSRVKLQEKHEHAVLTRHPETRIRFRFPDQYMLEAIFSSQEPAAALYVFLQTDAVEESLRLADTIHFDLSVGPPPRPIKRDDTRPLHRLDLTPAAIVNVAIRSNGSSHGPVSTCRLLVKHLTENVMDNADVDADADADANVITITNANANPTTDANSDASTNPRPPLINPAMTASVSTSLKPSWLKLFK